MPKRISKRLSDPNQLALAIVKLSTGQTVLPDAETLSRIMAEMGRRGGKIGGKRRLKTMTSEQRSAVATKAANARWKRKDK